jgi:S1-C subfamily serine protease
MTKIARLALLAILHVTLGFLASASAQQHVSLSTPKPTKAEPIALSPLAPSTWSVPPMIREIQRRILPVEGQIFVKESQQYVTITRATAVIERTGRVITNDHVQWEWGMEISLSGKVQQIRKRRADRIVVQGQISQVVGYHQADDILVLHIPYSAEFPPLLWTELVITEPIRVIGNPEGLAKSVMPGTVINQDAHTIFIDAQTVPGVSGGLLINSLGEGGGIVFAKYPAVQIDRISLARPARRVVEILAELEKRKAFDNLNDPNRVPVELD